MQYILNEDEFEEYQDVMAKRSEVPSYLDLSLFCIKVADTMPINSWKGENEPWGCIYEKRPNQYKEDEWYCDECPCQNICPMPQEVSQ